MGQSWSGIRKRLEEDLLCYSLKGRVQYQITKYRKSHDESGRIAILFDGHQIFKRLSDTGKGNERSIEYSRKDLGW